MKKKAKNLVLPLSEHFWDTQYKNVFAFFALNNIYKPYLKLFLDIIKFSFRFLGLPGTSKQTICNFMFFSKGQILRPFQA